MDKTVPSAFIKVYDDAILPTRATTESAGFDLYAHNYSLPPSFNHPVFLSCFTAIGLDPKRTLWTAIVIGTGVKINPETIPYLSGHYFQLCLRSSLRMRGLTQNGFGVIDIDYPDEIKVYIQPAYNGSIGIKTEDRIAQLVPVKHAGDLPIFNEFKQDKARTGGMGSTGR